jgi:hypothetical protein
MRLRRCAVTESFSKYETQDDRTNQQQVADVLLAYLSSYEVVGTGLDGKSYFEFKETKVELNLPQDYDIYHHGRYVAVAEVKCRNAPYDLEYMITDGMLVTSKRLNDLRDFHRHGKHVLIVTRTSDGHILYTTMQVLLDNRDKLKTKGEGCIKTDHGKKDKAGTGTIIPFSLLMEIPS